MMYQPIHFRDEDTTRKIRLIDQNPLGILVTNGPSGLMANALPFLFTPDGQGGGVLRAHFARANPQWREAESGQEALAIFQDANAYVSPGFYPSKQQTGKVVPTWNYAQVQAKGPMRVIEDPIWLRQLLDDLTDRHERAQAKAKAKTKEGEIWRVSDAPPDFIAQQLQGIVGVEITVARLEGKRKLSQNRSAEDREGVKNGLREMAAQNMGGGTACARVADMMDEATRS